MNKAESYLYKRGMRFNQRCVSLNTKRRMRVVSTPMYVIELNIRVRKTQGYNYYMIYKAWRSRNKGEILLEEDKKILELKFRKIAMLTLCMRAKQRRSKFARKLYWISYCRSYGYFLMIVTSWIKPSRLRFT